jgi:NAD(P)-dependent dehydrogenase (short-subunit alcohol dehydrogenase family)
VGEAVAVHAIQYATRGVWGVKLSLDAAAAGADDEGMTPSPNPIALITGGNRGIGRSTALAVAADGTDVLLTYREHAEEAAAVVGEVEALGRKAAALQLDVGVVASFDAFREDVAGTLAATFGRETFDFLVHNGAANITATYADQTEEDFDRMVDMHFKGPYFLTQKLLGLIADRGAVVNFSSGVMRVVTPERSVYGSVKGAVEVLTRYQAVELGGRGIRVNTVAPGPVATDFSGAVLRNTPALQETIAGVTALGRYAVADDIGPAIASLLQPGNHWITGERIEVSGGLHL